MGIVERGEQRGRADHHTEPLRLRASSTFTIHVIGEIILSEKVPTVDASCDGRKQRSSAHPNGMLGWWSPSGRSDPIVEVVIYRAGPLHYAL